ncbi:hypothetical protein [Hymenobacter armeniacus]|uniref:hypothetical protein n=1 Tax=Hymenobacter armeniacus TaxID=2771358 RepID=UPI001686A650|nr:hypothetical protein [Hymenobacter armeniacus]
MPGKAESTIYHTHPRCKVALGIAETARVLGMGEGRHECPFCYLLGQFKTSRLATGAPAREPAGGYTSSSPARENAYSTPSR